MKTNIELFTSSWKFNNVRMKVALIVLLIAVTLVVARDPLCPKQEDTDTVLIHPHESDLSKFYICASNGTLTEFQCAEGLIFDAEVNVCNWE